MCKTCIDTAFCVDLCARVYTCFTENYLIVIGVLKDIAKKSAVNLSPGY